MGGQPKIKNKLKIIFWALLPIVFGVFFVALGAFAVNHAKLIKIWQPRNDTAIVVQSLIATEEQVQEKSKYFYLNKLNEEPQVAAAAYLVGDINTGEIIIAKNQDQKFPIASISKLMTALVASEIVKPEDVAQVSPRAIATYGTNGNF